MEAHIQAVKKNCLIARILYQGNTETVEQGGGGGWRPWTLYLFHRQVAHRVKFSTVGREYVLVLF